MFVYWAMFVVPALSALTGGQSWNAARGPRIALAMLLIVFAILVGARYEVGGDWFVYEEINDSIRYETLAYSLSFGDPGFGLVSWIFSRMGLGSVGPSMFCAVILIYGIWRFSQQLSDPWLALTAAVPYLLIVVGMGYVRQGAAIGFVLLALTSVADGRILNFLAWLGIATLFHVSAICLLPVLGVVIVRKTPIAFIPLGIVGTILYFTIVQARLERLYENYVVAEYDSSGALIRLVMNAVPAGLFLLYRNRFPIGDAVRTLWTVIALLSFGLVALVLVSPATTAIDRIGLYLIPIQLFVFGHIVSVAAATTEGRRVLSFFAVLYYAAVMYIWLNYATHAEYWLPYKFQPIG